MALINGVPGSNNINSRIKGFDIVLANLNREIEAIKGRSMKGLIKAAIYVKREMEHTPPLIPVDKGNLRASWFTAPLNFGKSTPTLLIGFTANYALYVHEMMDSKINWSRRNSGPKFLESAIKRNGNQILKIIKDNVQIP